MVRNRRKLRRPRVRTRARAQLDRLRTGIPVTIKNRSTDPPNLPISFNWSVRVRYLINTVIGGSSGQVVISEATSPTTIPIITMGQPTSGQQPRVSFNLPTSSVLRSAFVRHYGYYPSSPNTDYNILNSEFAIGKVTCYGPSSGSDGIVLNAIFDTDLPGFVGTDHGDRVRRPVVSATPSRLRWISNTTADPSRGAFSVAYLNVLYDGPAAAYVDLGVLDVTVLIRRSVLSIPLPTAKVVVGAAGSSDVVSALHHMTEKALKDA